MTIGMNVYKEICFVDITTGYNCELQRHDIQYCHTVAAESHHIATICQILESTLSDADERDRNQRLLHIKQQQPLPLPPLTGIVLPPGVNDNLDNDNDEVQNVDEEIEEDLLYRRRALDFTIGHVASKVRENNYNDKGNRTKQQQQHGDSTTRKTDNSKSNTLLESMLQSLNQPQQRGHEEISVAPTTNHNDKIVTTTAPLPQQMLMDDDEEEEEAVIEIKSEFVTKDSNISVDTSTKYKRKR